MFLNKQKGIGAILIVFTILVIMSTPFRDFASIPTEIRVFEGKSSVLKFSLPVSSTATSSNPEVVQVGRFDQDESEASPAMNVEALQSGIAELQFKLGSIPLKKIKVNVLPDIKVYPGGQTIGVKLNSAGALVVGHHFIETDQGKVSPGEEANLRVGDVILKMNGNKIEKLDDIGDIANEAGENGEDIKLEILRGKEKVNITIQPRYDKKEEKYRLGLYIRNSAAGVGTLTFYHEESGAYGALGHVISDVDTQKPILVGDGTIVNSSVSSIEKGAQGQPGEKFARHEDGVLGDIKKNTPFGIFGHMHQKLNNGILDEAIPIGLSEEIEKGPAHILTVVEGQKVEKFDIEITEIVQQKFPATKGLVIKVTDPVLLEKTGGIIQGMSGSPIIQNGKLVGAVTHVFVNDPTSGYGCFIEWMLQDAGIELKPTEKPKAS
ncbi:SpoIVB peptidase [Caldalkalibacillus mannanilyticus]|uniref:SpoIVB peptidase n=1 Tax=Caldalkalibacillus mannanilyticus TaxID=1418 RepID=UPI00046B0088|nr:SpoIVB peptidase [Caldalkalibacillus mannanilyticus]